MSWFFEQEEEGIILEDDCVPSRSFFFFCADLLERYRYDTRIMEIGGTNFENEKVRGKEHSYFFSNMIYIWGWATWRRAWKKFDFKIKNYPKAKQVGFFKYYFPNPIEKMYRLRKFNKTISGNGNVDWWDYQWDFARYSNSGLAIVPNTNLVKNLGFGDSATHTTNANSENVSMEGLDIEFPLCHPPFMVRDVVSDKKYFKKNK